MSGKFYLPSKIATYVKRLKIQYTLSGKTVRSEVIEGGRVFVREGASYDNWNNGTYGHDVMFFLPPEVFGKIELGRQNKYRQCICNDLKTCARSVENEWVNDVFFEYEDDNDPEYQQSFTISGRVQINPDTLSIWKPGQIRLFISHRDFHKVEAKTLANALEGYGISAFVAHDTIELMTKWQAEILKGLETMEIMLAFVTADFQESTWTNQEIGFALGRNVPVVSLKLQRSDPSGFISNQQALRGGLEDSAASAADIYTILAEKRGNKERLQSALITAFVRSADFIEAKRRFDRLNNVVQSLSDDEVDQIVNGFKGNDQIYKAGYLTSKYQRLQRFLKRTTGRNYVIEGNVISLHREKVDDEIPF